MKLTSCVLGLLAGTSLSAVTVASVVLSPQEQAGERPNIVLIVADDLG